MSQRKQAKGKRIPKGTKPWNQPQALQLPPPITSRRQQNRLQREVVRDVVKAEKPRPKAKTSKKRKPKEEESWWESGIKGIGKAIGKIGAGIITGFGDYDVNTNSVMAVGTEGKIGGEIPVMMNTKDTNVVRHREYIGKIFGTSLDFATAIYPINPGLASTFPWLSTVANSYQRYRWRGLVFEYVPASADYAANTAMGTIGMATLYNPLLPAFNDKQVMMNSEYANEAKPSKKFIHPIECDPNKLTVSEMFIRNGSVPANADQRLYDIGVLTVASSSNPTTSSLGDLWATYECELIQPFLPADIGSNLKAYGGSGNSAANGAPFGTSFTVYSGSTTEFLVWTSGTVLTFKEEGVYLLDLAWSGGSATYTAPGFTPGSGLGLSNPTGGGSYPQNGLAGITSVANILICTVSLAPATLTIGGAGVFPTGLFFNLYCVPLPNGFNGISPSAQRESTTFEKEMYRQILNVAQRYGPEYCERISEMLEDLDPGPDRSMEFPLETPTEKPSHRSFEEQERVYHDRLRQFVEANPSTITGYGNLVGAVPTHGYAYKPSPV